MGELALVGDHSTVPLTRVSGNTVFSKSQKTRKAGTLCTNEATFLDKLGISYFSLVTIHLRSWQFFMERGVKNLKNLLTSQRKKNCEKLLMTIMDGP